MAEVPADDVEVKLTAKVAAIALSPPISKEQIRKAQMQDADMKHVLTWKERQDVKPEWKEVSALSSATKAYWVNWDALAVHDGVLVRRWESEDGEKVDWKIALPRTLRPEILKELHNSPTAGHLGVNKLLNKVKQRYYWVGMAEDVRSWVRRCNTCAQIKNPPRKPLAPLQQYAVGAPIERVAMDILGPLPKTDQGNVYVLVIGDYFTKWVEAFALPNQEAETIAKVFVEEFVCRFGVPKELHTDQGRNFESNLMKEICKLLGIKKTRTCPYHPQGDGFVERFNRTLIAMVTSALDPERHQRDWDERIPYAMLAYRTSVQSSTKETPSMMMLGRETTLPIDVLVETPSSEENEKDDYAYRLRSTLQDVHENARSNLKLAASKQRRMYDRNTMSRTFSKGDWVWLRSTQKKKGVTPKLMTKWVGPYLVIAKLTDVVYRIQMSQRAKPKVIHLNRLKKYEGPPRDGWLNKTEPRRNPLRNRTLPARYGEM